MSNSRSVLSVSEIRQIIELRQKKYTLSEIAKNIGISPSTVSKYNVILKTRVVDSNGKRQKLVPDKVVDYSDDRIAQALKSYNLKLHRY